MNKKTIFNIIFIICIIVFITLLVMYNMGRLNSFDTTIYKYVTYYKNDILTDLAMLLSFLCSTWFIAVVCIFIMIVFKNKKIGFYTTLSVMICYVLNTLIKNIVLRPRPTGINLINENGFSFPSGHSMEAISFYGFIMYVVYKSNLDNKLKCLVYIIDSLIIFFIGISRIYLGVHYPSDVIAGFSLATALMILYIHIVNIKESN